MPLKFVNKFIQTSNVKNFNVAMDLLRAAPGEKLGISEGRAGLGKTETARTYAAHNKGKYIFVWEVWKTSNIYFLKDLARLLEIESLGPWKAPDYTREIARRLTVFPECIIVDQAERMPASFLNLIRDFADQTNSVFMLLGEKKLKTMVEDNEAFASRCTQIVEFGPMDAADVMAFGTASFGFKMIPVIAHQVCKITEGDFRLVRNLFYRAMDICNSRDTAALDTGVLGIAKKRGLGG